MADTEKLVEQLSGLTVLEIAGLVKQLEEKWGVSAAAPVAVAAAPATGGGGAAAAPAAEAKTKVSEVAAGDWLASRQETSREGEFFFLRKGSFHDKGGFR